jgi:hypothetical protein
MDRCWGHRQRGPVMRLWGVAIFRLFWMSQKKNRSRKPIVSLIQLEVKLSRYLTRNTDGTKGIMTTFQRIPTRTILKVTQAH